MPARYPAIFLGPVPIHLVNAALGTELVAGMARLSATAHRHMALDHSSDYPVCFRALPLAISAPTFVGQDLKHARNYVMVRRVGLPDGRAVLVAIGLEPEQNGFYAVRTSYLIPQRSIDQRRAAGRLMIPRPK